MATTNFITKYGIPSTADEALTMGGSPVNARGEQTTPCFINKEL